MYWIKANNCTNTFKNVLLLKSVQLYAIFVMCIGDKIIRIRRPGQRCADSPRLARCSGRASGAVYWLKLDITIFFCCFCCNEGLYQCERSCFAAWGPRQDLHFNMQDSKRCARVNVWPRAGAAVARAHRGTGKVWMRRAIQTEDATSSAARAAPVAPGNLPVIKRILSNPQISTGKTKMLSDLDTSLEGAGVSRRQALCVRASIIHELPAGYNLPANLDPIKVRYFRIFYILSIRLWIKFACTGRQVSTQCHIQSPRQPEEQERISVAFMTSSLQRIPASVLMLPRCFVLASWSTKMIAEG